LSRYRRRGLWILVVATVIVGWCVMLLPTIQNDLPRLVCWGPLWAEGIAHAHDFLLFLVGLLATAVSIALNSRSLLALSACYVASFLVHFWLMVD